MKQPSSIEIIKKKYELKHQKFPDDFPFNITSLVFTNGNYKSEGRKFIIEQLTIEERRIIINFIGPTDILNQFYNDLKSILLKLDTRSEKGLFNEFVKTNETICVVKLDFQIKDLFINSPMLSFSENIKNSIPGYDCKIDIIPDSIRLKIKYSSIPDKLSKNKIMITDKDFTIGVRDKTNPDDMIFVTSSPSDSDVHFKLLTQLENIIKQKKRK